MREYGEYLYITGKVRSIYPFVQTLPRLLEAEHKQCPQVLPEKIKKVSFVKLCVSPEILQSYINNI